MGGYDFDDCDDENKANPTNKSVAKTAEDPKKKRSALVNEWAEEIEVGNTSLVELGESRPFERQNQTPRKKAEFAFSV